MPRTADDVESFLLRLNRHFERDEETFIVSSGVDGTPVAVFVTEPIIVLRVDIGKLPDGVEKQNAIFRMLLNYNSTDLVHAAYALEGDEIVLTSGLPLENVDENELAAVLGDIELALVRHVKPVRELAMG